MKLPNGFGSVYKFSGKRRNPWTARKTVGWTEATDGKRSQPIYKFIGYYPTRAEALTALTDYNKNPYDIDAAAVTFSEVYDKWSDRKFEEISDSNIKGYKASYRICENLYQMKFSDIKLSHLQAAVDNSGKNLPTLKKLKSLFSQLFKYAVIHEIISRDKDVTSYVDISRAGNPNAIDRKPFSRAEIEKVWEQEKASDYISIILMLIYSGVRIGELLDLEKSDVHLSERWFQVRESKTKDGVRAVPIAKKTLHFFNRWMNKNDCKYVLSTPDGERFLYRNYYDSYWTPIIEQMGMGHRPHDTRHTCISLMTAANVSDKIIKKIVGHKGQSVTEIVYTHFEMQELLDAIDKI